MTELTERELDRVIEAAHPSRPDREALTRAAVEAILTAREGEWRGTEAVLRGEIRRAESGIAAYDDLTARLARVEALAIASRMVVKSFREVEDNRRLYDAATHRCVDLLDESLAALAAPTPTEVQP